MQKHNYAHQVLKTLNISISSGSQQILTYKEDVFPRDVELTSNYVLYRQISTDNKKEIINLRYEDLLKKGYQISKRRAKGKYFYGQHMEYYLVRNTSGLAHLGSVPPEHRIEFNVVENWIRLVGRNSSGKKSYLGIISRNAPEKKEMNLDDYADVFEDYLQEISPFTYIEQEQKLNIPEIPILLTSDGKIVCLPLMKDNPTIGIFGKKGMGKTLLLHRIADCVYHKWHKRVIIGNDIANFQTRSWSLPWDSKKHGYFIKLLEKIGEPTLPLPCVYLTPNESDLKKIDFENETSYKISLPFGEIMKNPNSFFEGTKDQLEQSEKYLTNLIYDNLGNTRPDGLLYCKTIEEIYSESG